ncbi:MAG: transposase [Tannerellaceae bacterium]|nr:transposase [Tannerellaceae bacterium]
MDDPPASFHGELHSWCLRKVICRQGIERQIVSLANGKYEKEVALLRSIPGIGLLGAIVLLTETGDIHRFSNNEQLHSFVGLKSIDRSLVL